ncbi:MAG: 4-alpha-glucanotransferase [Lachnospiraceae bacterium]|nr:4-alpha-glucanotransferase [Lachnospiraceae bacterium]
MKRSSGILMPVFSLPSPYGIGTLGKAAYEFVDFLKAAGQTWWQILPLGPTSLGDSPYQSPSTFAGNPYFIDPDLLAEDGLLTAEEIEAYDFGDDPERVDYGLLYQNRYRMLEAAAARGMKKYETGIAAFRKEQAGWLEDYALYMACKKHFDMLCWLDWPDKKLRMRDPAALHKYRNALKEEIDLQVFMQFLFFKQWAALRAYAHEAGIKIFGDMPLYMALDSAEVWAAPQFFLLDEENYPVKVAGVPPDYFSEDGQLWGNPLYNYDAMEKDGFGWWIRRVDGASKLYDAIRFDHFRGLASYWAVPYGAKTAKTGKWEKGPGMKLVGVLRGWFPQIQFIAEDLGVQTPDVVELLEDSGFPGMKVLEFAFDSKEESSYLPHMYEHNCVCYIGTHDNDTLLGWKEQALEADVNKAKCYLGLNGEEGFSWGVIRGGMSSVADLFVTQMQDYLELGSEARINSPGIAGGNWRWRMLPGAADEKLAEKLFAMTVLFGRCERPAPEEEEEEAPEKESEETSPVKEDK